MAAQREKRTLHWLDTLYREGSLAQLSDEQLLEHFVGGPVTAREVAFEVLVRRHGPMVLALCRGVLRNDHDASDAFQATFVVLARRASNIRDRDRLGTWLGRVARRIARRSRRDAARLASRERRFTGNEPVAASVDFMGFEAASLVREQVDRLPKTDRLLLRMTYWEGKTYEEAAELLSWPIGTVRSRLSRVRERLRGRLTRLGLARALALTGSAVLDDRASIAEPMEVLILQTVRAATRSAGCLKAAVEAGVVPSTVASMVKGELATMTTISWKTVPLLLLFGGIMTAGVMALAAREPAPAPARPTVRVVSQQKEASKLLLMNKGAEEGEGDSPKAWTSGATIPGVEYIWSRSGHAGKASLCLKKTAQRYFPIAQWSQKLDHEGDSPRLKVSAWVKADRVTKAILDAQFLDSQGKGSHAWVSYIGPQDTDKPPVTHDWKRYEGVVEIPAGTKKIIIAPQIYGPGTVWFDDLDAEYTNDPAIDPTGS